MTDITVSSYPHLKDNAKTKIIDKFKKVVNPSKVSTIQEDREKLRELLFKK